MRTNTNPPGPAETKLVVQAVCGGLGTQQVLARDLLVSTGLKDGHEATAYVRMVGSQLSAVLKEALTRAANPEIALRAFEFSRTNQK